MNSYINSKESISEKCKKAHQSRHQLFGCTENSLFSCKCNKMNKIYTFQPINSDPYQYKYNIHLHENAGFFNIEMGFFTFFTDRFFPHLIYVFIKKSPNFNVKSDKKN